MLAYFKNIVLSSAGSALLVKATLAAAMPRPGCGQLRAAGRSHWLAGAADLGGSLPVPTAARAAIQPGSVRFWLQLGNLYSCVQRSVGHWVWVRPEMPTAAIPSPSGP